MTSCRGILIAGVSNRSRTQMAEGFLRSLTSSRVFVKSGGVMPGTTLHPLAVRAMADVGVDISSQSPSSLESAQRQRATYDVYVSIDGSYTNRRADRYQGTHSMKLEDDAERHGMVGHDAMLFPSTPNHWATAMDAADARQQWNLWSPRDPSIFYENSTRKFQDHLYEGEPLFMRLQDSKLRLCAKVAERWEVEEVADVFAMERSVEHEQRVATARDAIALHCVTLVRRLEEYYDETLCTNADCVQHLASSNDTVKQLTARGQRV